MPLEVNLLQISVLMLAFHRRVCRKVLARLHFSQLPSVVSGSSSFQLLNSSAEQPSTIAAAQSLSVPARILKSAVSRGDAPAAQHGKLYTALLSAPIDECFRTFAKLPEAERPVCAQCVLHRFAVGEKIDTPLVVFFLRALIGHCHRLPLSKWQAVVGRLRACLDRFSPGDLAITLRFLNHHVAPMATKDSLVSKEIRLFLDEGLDRFRSLPEYILDLEPGELVSLVYAAGDWADRSQLEKFVFAQFQARLKNLHAIEAVRLLQSTTVLLFSKAQDMAPLVDEHLKGRLAELNGNRLAGLAQTFTNLSYRNTKVNFREQLETRFTSLYLNQQLAILAHCVLFEKSLTHAEAEPVLEKLQFLPVYLQHCAPGLLVTFANLLNSQRFSRIVVLPIQKSLVEYLLPRMKMFTDEKLLSFASALRTVLNANEAVSFLPSELKDGNALLQALLALAPHSSLPKVRRRVTQLLRKGKDIAPPELTISSMHSIGFALTKHRVGIPSWMSAVAMEIGNHLDSILLDEQQSKSLSVVVNAFAVLAYTNDSFWRSLADKLNSKAVALRLAASLPSLVTLVWGCNVFGYACCLAEQVLFDLSDEVVATLSEEIRVKVLQINGLRPERRGLIPDVTERLLANASFSEPIPSKARAAARALTTFAGSPDAWKVGVVTDKGGWVSFAGLFTGDRFVDWQELDMHSVFGHGSQDCADLFTPASARQLSAGLVSQLLDRSTPWQVRATSVQQQPVTQRLVPLCTQRLFRLRIQPIAVIPVTPAMFILNTEVLYGFHRVNVEVLQRTGWHVVLLPQLSTQSERASYLHRHLRTHWSSR